MLGVRHGNRLRTAAGNTRIPGSLLLGVSLISLAFPENIKA